MKQRSGPAHVDDALVAVTRTPSVSVRLVATAVRLLLLVIELAVGVLSVPLLVPVLALRLSGRLCTWLDALLDGEHAAAHRNEVEEQAVRAPMASVAAWRNSGEGQAPSQLQRRRVADVR